MVKLWQKKFLELVICLLNMQDTLPVN